MSESGVPYVEYDPRLAPPCPLIGGTLILTLVKVDAMASLAERSAGGLRSCVTEASADGRRLLIRLSLPEADMVAFDHVDGKDMWWMLSMLVDISSALMRQACIRVRYQNRKALEAFRAMLEEQVSTDCFMVHKTAQWGGWCWASVACVLGYLGTKHKGRLWLRRMSWLVLWSNWWHREWRQWEGIRWLAVEVHRWGH